MLPPGVGQLPPLALPSPLPPGRPAARKDSPPDLEESSPPPPFLFEKKEPFKLDLGSLIAAPSSRVLEAPLLESIL